MDYFEYKFVPENDQYRLDHPGHILVGASDKDAARELATMYLGLNVIEVDHEHVSASRKGILEDTINFVTEPYIHEDYR